MEYILFEGGFCIILAFLLDLCIGDPQTRLHPVRLLGSFAKNIERIFPKKRWAGVVFWFFIVSSSLFLYKVFFHLCGSIVDIFLIYFCISVKALKEAATSVREALERGSLSLARERLSSLVGRDRERLSKEEVIRAALEGTSENLTDAIVAPLFYAAILPPFALIFRVANTLDAMYGYKRGVYKEFGWFSARMDDVLCFFPARVCAVILLFILFLEKKNWRRGWSTLRVFAKKHPSPNAGIPQSIVAGSLGVRLGGMNFYNGIPSFYPYLGEGGEEFKVSHIKWIEGIVYKVGFLSLSLSVFVCFLLKNSFF